MLEVSRIMVSRRYPRRSTQDWLLEAIALAALIATFAMVFGHWQRLPGFARRGSGGSLGVMVFLNAGVYVLLSAGARYQQLIHVPFEIDRERPEVKQLLLQMSIVLKAILMVATYRPAARFIEKTRDAYPGLIYSNVSFVGSTALAEELKLLGPRYTNGVIVTQVVPAVSGYSSAVLEYKNALAKYFPGEAADYVSFEGYVAANVLIQGIKRAGPQIDTEKLIDTLENKRNLDLGLGTQLSFGRSEHQASNKVWGTALDESGRYQPLELE